MRFKDFSLFNMFMTRPDPEYDIAFLLFDQKQQVGPLAETLTGIRLLFPIQMTRTLMRNKLIPLGHKVVFSTRTSTLIDSCQED